MKLPQMILFDYGQTLVNETWLGGGVGTAAVMEYATKNKHNLTPAQVQAEADVINKELGRFDPTKRHLAWIEVPNCMFSPYLYESMGIEIPLSHKERDMVFWNATAPGKPTEGIEDFLDFLREKGIRTGVISNITYCSEAVNERINTMVPNHNFEFIIATSDYIYRKPHRRIFQLALEKADLKPEDVWYIGDNYECDVKGAAGVGMFPVWYQGAIDLPYKDDEAVLTVKSWHELMKIINEI